MNPALEDHTMTLGLNLAQPGATPVNRFAHRRTFPGASFTDVVRPNADTVYSTVWFGLAASPPLIELPDSGGRYYQPQMLDRWTDPFAAPGGRTTGGGAQRLLLAGPGCQGEVPAGAMLIRSPTTTGWIIGRTQTNGAADYANVHRFQDAMSIKPLQVTAEASKPDPSWDAKTPTVQAIEKLDAQQFLALFAELTKANPPRATTIPSCIAWHASACDRASHSRWPRCRPWRVPRSRWRRRRACSRSSRG